MKKCLLLILCVLACLSFPAAAQYGGGSGTSGDPYLITSVSDLGALATAINGGSTQSGVYFQQTVDLDLNVSPYNTGSGWPCMMDFAGTYDGNNKTISNLFINNTTSTNGVGLFAGWMNGTIKNLGIINCSITATTKNYVAAISGRAYGTALMQNCYVSGGTISGQRDVGAICGLLNATGHITQCYASGVTITGTENVGGIAGYNDGSGTLIDNSYSSSAVTASIRYVGGVIGYQSNSASVQYCYVSSSTIDAPAYKGGVAGGVLSGSITACFYDNTKYTTDNGIGTGASTTLMHTQSTFTDAGWNFTTIWELIGANYPRLQSTPEEALPVELTTFSAASGGMRVALQWTTATELNNDGFFVERSRGDCGTGWETAGFVAGHGTTNTLHQYSFFDEPGSGTFSYRLKQIDRDGKCAYSDVVHVTIGTPSALLLEQNYPNPFNPSTTLRYTLPSESRVTLEVFDIYGRRVAELVNRTVSAGYHTVQWNASEASGIYFCRLAVVSLAEPGKSFTETRRMILLR